ncbi:hypothetical protein GCM10023224_24450 [Streptomonospora halophila]|uniref:Uncharacterized protein n=1 Tax=Streptomonospora halophila TaxID=427369 RepID=A0ABP9GFG8_9ACTN
MAQRQLQQRELARGEVGGARAGGGAAGAQVQGELAGGERGGLRAALGAHVAVLTVVAGDGRGRAHGLLTARAAARRRPRRPGRRGGYGRLADGHTAGRTGGRRIAPGGSDHGGRLRGETTATAVAAVRYSGFMPVILPDPPRRRDETTMRIRSSAQRGTARADGRPGGMRGERRRKEALTPDEAAKRSRRRAGAVSPGDRRRVMRGAAAGTGGGALSGRARV